jgi:hypothetical protein
LIPMEDKEKNVQSHWLYKWRNQILFKSNKKGQFCDDLRLDCFFIKIKNKKLAVILKELEFSFLVYRKNESILLFLKGLHSSMYCELISTVFLFLIIIGYSSIKKQ